MNARVKYYQQYENLGECYAIEVLGSDGEWGLDTAFRLLPVEGDKRAGANFVDYELLTRLRWLFDLGYNVNFLGLPICLGYRE